MKIEWKVFHSKVARRIFYLFVLSALLPVALLAFFHFFQMAKQTNETSQEQVRQYVKTIGMDLIGRLVHLENQINLLGKGVENLPPEAPKNKIMELSKVIPGFISMMLVTKKGSPIVLKGRQFETPNGIFTGPVGNTWIMLPSQRMGEANGYITMIHKLSENKALIGKIQNIWSFDIPGDNLFWVLGPDELMIYQNQEYKHPKVLAKHKQDKESGVFVWQKEKQDYFVGYWSLFLKQRFNSDNWIAVIAKPKDSVLAIAKNIYTLFIPTIILALLLTIFLSQSQIRRLLVPLEKLRNATRRYAKQNFLEPVEVKSGDEFEELGTAFNKMGQRLYKQFKALSILSMLDQSILSQKDGEAVLRLIFKELKEVIEYDLLALGVISQPKHSSISLMLDDVKQSEIQIIEQRLKKKEYQELKKNQEIKYRIKKNTLPGYLSMLSEQNLHFLFVYPILHRGEPTALIAMGFDNKNVLDEFNEEALQDILYRASVAFTHAEWEERLYRQAHYDDLTGLPNRLLMRKEMSKAVFRSKANGTYCVLMFVDLDNIKDVNDAMGHGVGDQFLALVAKRMQSQIGDLGLLSRIGGDEFTIFMTDLTSDVLARKKSAAIAELLLQSFDDPFLLQDMEYYASASIGIAIFPEDAKTTDEVLKYADMSMYHASKTLSIFLKRSRL